MTSLCSSHLFLIAPLPLLLGSTSFYTVPLANLTHSGFQLSLLCQQLPNLSFFLTSTTILCFYLVVGHLHIDMAARKQNKLKLNLSSSSYKCTPLPNIYVCLSMSNLFPSHPLTLSSLLSRASFPQFCLLNFSHVWAPGWLSQ